MTIPSAEPAMVSEIIASRVDAALAGGVVESRRLSMARASIDMRVEQDVAPCILTPFAHLQTRGGDGHATLHVDVAALRERDAEALDLDGLPDNGVVISDGDRIVHLHRHTAAVLDRAAGRIRALVRNTNGVASWYRAKPLQLPLSIFFADRGVDLLHGGLVSLQGNGVLIAGTGGSGKSTLTLASLLEGLDFLGDDCVAAQEIEGRFEGHSVFGSSCLEHAHLRRFPLLGGTGADDVEAKAVLPIAQLFADRMASSTTIRAIVLPRVTHGDQVTLQPTSGREALLALAPSSILGRAVPAAGALARMARLVREIPAFRLEMGPVDEAGPRMRALLEELRRQRWLPKAPPGSPQEPFLPRRLLE